MARACLCVRVCRVWLWNVLVVPPVSGDGCRLGQRDLKVYHMCVVHPCGTSATCGDGGACVTACVKCSLSG